MNLIQRSDINFCLFILDYIQRNNIDFKEFCEKLGYNKENMKHILCLTYLINENDIKKLSEITEIPFELLKVSISGLKHFKEHDDLNLEQTYNTVQSILRHYLCDKTHYKEVLNQIDISNTERLGYNFFDFGMKLIENGKINISSLFGNDIFIE